MKNNTFYIVVFVKSKWNDNIFTEDFIFGWRKLVDLFTNVIYVRIWSRESNIILNYENSRAADIVSTCVVVIRWQMVLRRLGRFIFPAIVAPDLKQFRLTL